jgi:isoquinoline 1-oxidoreductase beta subunit
MAIAVVAEAKIGENGRVQVSKLTAVADLGQLINPDIARQHIEGGLLFGMQLAVGAPVIVQHGLAGPSRFGDFKLPLLADMPEVTVELLPSNAPAADAWDCAVPVAAPAIAGALFAGSGKRFRTIPFTADQS